MSSPYLRPPSEEPRPAARFNHLDRLMLTLIVMLVGVAVLLFFATRLRS